MLFQRITKSVKMCKIVSFYFLSIILNIVFKDNSLNICHESLKLLKYFYNISI